MGVCLSTVSTFREILGVKGIWGGYSEPRKWEWYLCLGEWHCYLILRQDDWRVWLPLEE